MLFWEVFFVLLFRAALLLKATSLMFKQYLLLLTNSFALFWWHISPRSLRCCFLTSLVSTKCLSYQLFDLCFFWLYFLLWSSLKIKTPPAYGGVDLWNETLWFLQGNFRDAHVLMNCTSLPVMFSYEYLLSVLPLKTIFITKISEAFCLLLSLVLHAHTVHQ